MYVTPAEWPSSPTSPKSHGQMPTASLFTTTVIRLTAEAASSSHGPSIASSPSIGRPVLVLLSAIVSSRYARGVQKVRRLTQLTTRHVHASYFVTFQRIVFCNWNALGPAFLQSWNSVVEELFILLFQPAICRADNVPLKIAPVHGVSGPPSNTWFLGPTLVHTRNGISIGSAVLARIKTVTDWPTDRQCTLLRL